MRATMIPDKDPADIVAGSGLLSMCAGDFVVSGLKKNTKDKEKEPE